MIAELMILDAVKNPVAWGQTDIVNHGEYYEVIAKSNAAAWGLVTDRGIGIDFEAGESYTIFFELKSDSLQTLRYNYIISGSGNMKINNLVVNKPNEWTKFSITFSSSVDRVNAGILLGGDLRYETSGISYLIRNIRIEKNIMRPQIDGIEIIPNPVDQNNPFLLAVQVSEVRVEFTTIVAYCGTFACGEEVI